MTAVERELLRVSHAEKRLRANAFRDDPGWKKQLGDKIPDKVLGNLQAVFQKAFAIIFEKGTGLIEKTYKKEDLEKDFLVRDFAVDLEMSRKDLFLLDASSELSSLISLAASAVEGAGLGALGIGLPDIVLFLSVVLRGCYETALRYGFSYDSSEERYFLLTALEGSLLKEEAWDTCSELVDSMMVSSPTPSEEEMQTQIRHTSDAFALDMLLTKFIQGIPVVGIVGGLTNPIYYRKILSYVRLKYKKRYLLSKKP